MPGFEDNAVARRAQTAVIFQSECHTHGELDERASRLAHALRALAVGSFDAGGRLAVMLPNSLEFIECLAASAKLGVASLTLNWHLRTDELTWILADAGAGALVAHSDLRAVVEAAVAGAGCPVLWVGDDYEARIAAAPDERIAYRWPTAWPVIYTSGTSGRPKGVVHGALADPEIMHLAQSALVAMWGYRPDDVHLVAGPLYHAGPSGYAGTTLYAGGTVVVMEQWDPEEFLRLIDIHHVTTTFLTPAHFIRLLEVPDHVFATHHVSSLRHVIHGGAPCPIEVKRRIMERLPRAEVWELYGMSEGGATSASPTEWLDRPGTVGRPWPGVEIRILDGETGDALPPGTDGWIYVKPAHGRFHYHGDDDKTAAAWRDDAFTVGDIGHLDRDGYLFITDRAVDMVIRSGVNLYPREVEEVLHRHPEVVDCAVFGVPDDRDGERLRAVVELRAGASTGIGDLSAWCAERLETYKVPTEIELCGLLPRDPNGKVLKRSLRDAAWAGTGRAL